MSNVQCPNEGLEIGHFSVSYPSLIYTSNFLGYIVPCKLLIISHITGK